MTRETLEQQRARHAWERCAGYRRDAEVKIAKGLPALIMNSGLMQILAFLESKGEAHQRVSKHLREWLHEKELTTRKDFPGVMNDLFDASPRQYQAIMIEAFAWLKWLRQLAPARNTNSRVN